MKVVIDTNVLVSGLLNPFGAPAEIVRMAFSGVLTICYDARLVTEYREVLLRPKFRFNEDQVDALLEYIEHHGFLASSVPLKQALADPDDEMFLEVAIAARAEYLITGNIKHFPKDRREGQKVVPVEEFVEFFRGKN